MRNVLFGKGLVLGVICLLMLTIPAIPALNVFEKDMIKEVTSGQIKPVEPKGRTIYVDDDAPPEWYDETHVRYIEEGIEIAESGDTVFVYSGTYGECWIRIDKPSIKVIGEDRDTTFIDAMYSSRVFTIKANSITISGFTIKYCDHMLQQSDVFFVQSSFNKIIGNRCEKNRCVINLLDDRNYVIGNIFEDNEMGIWSITNRNYVYRNHKVPNLILLF